MLHSSINPTLVHSRAHPTTQPLIRSSSNFPGSPRQQLPRPSLSCSSSVRTCDAVVFDSKAGKRMNEFHEVELNVRDYELDQFGVVNNNVYASYCQHAEDELMKRIGINVDTIMRTGDVIATTQLSLKFFAPLKSGDRFVVKVRISDVSATRAFFEHFIFKIPNLEPILEARITCVWLNKEYRPIRIPAKERSKILRFLNY